MTLAFMAPTHGPLGMVFALAALRLLELFHVPLPATPAECDILAVVCGGIGGLLPDIDRASSKAANSGRALGDLVMQGTGVRRASFIGLIVGAVFTLINLPIHMSASYVSARLGHRGVIHSIAMSAVISILYAGLVIWLVGYDLNVWLAVILAYLSVPPIVALLTLASSRGLWLTMLTLLLIFVIVGGLAALVLDTRTLWQVVSHLSLPGLGQIVRDSVTQGSRWGLIVPLIFAGEISHLFGDGCCKSSVPYLFWPFFYTKRGQQPAGLLRWRPLPLALRVKANGAANQVIGPLALMVALVLLIGGELDWVQRLLDKPGRSQLSNFTRLRDAAMRRTIWLGITAMWLGGAAATAGVAFGLDLSKLLAKSGAASGNSGGSKAAHLSWEAKALHNLASHPQLPIAALLLAIAFTGFAIWLFRHAAKEQRRNQALAASHARHYMVTISSEVEVSISQMREWFYGVRSALHSTLWQRWTGLAPHIIWSMVSQNHQITLYLSVVGGNPATDRAVAAALGALHPTLSEKRLEVNPRLAQGTAHCAELHLARASYLPIRTEFDKEHDPLDVVLRNMAAEEGIALCGIDILMRPAVGGWSRAGQRAIVKVRSSEAQKEAAERSTLVREQNKDIEEKMAQDRYGMDTIIRIYAIGEPQKAAARLGTIARSFGQYAARNHFDMRPPRYGPAPLSWPLSWEDENVLSPAECAAVAHLPRPHANAGLTASGSITLPPDARQVRTRVPASEASKYQTVPTPPRPPQEQIKRRIPIGYYEYGDGSAGIVSLENLMMFRMMHILGPMGVGKSTLIGRMAKAAFDTGDGGMVMEPAFDLSRSIMERLPRRDWRRTFYIDPPELYARGWAFTLNVMECPDPLLVPQIQSILMLILRTMVGSKTWDSAPRMQTMMEASVQTLLEAEELPTINDFYRFLNEPAYRTRLARLVRNDNLSSFWTKFFAGMKPEEQQKALDPVNHRIVKLLLNDQVSGIVSSHRSTLNLRRIMDEGKILLVNLPGAGNPEEGGDPAMAFIGMLLVMKMRIAANMRGDTPEELRRPWHCFLDEGHNFITADIPKMYTELRKYRVSLALAHQTLAQIPRDVLNVLINAVGNRIDFRAEATDAKFLAEYSLGKQVSAYDLGRLQNTYAYARLIEGGSPMPVCTIRTFPWSEPPAWDYPPADFGAGVAYARQLYPSPSANVESLISLVERSLHSREESYRHREDKALLQKQMADYQAALDALIQASNHDFAAVQELQLRRSRVQADWLADHPGACDSQIELVKWLSMLDNTIPLVLVVAEARRRHSPDVLPAQLLEEVAA